MTTTGDGIFYDGRTSDRRKVAVDIGSDAVQVSAPDGALLAQWRFTDIAPLTTPAGVLRLGLANATAAARLEIHDRTLAGALLAHVKPTDRTGLTDRRTRVKVVAFSLAAIATLIGGAIWGVPLLADRIAPHLPVALEMRLGAAIDMEVRQALDSSTDGKAFECGTGDSSSALAARDAFAKLVASLEGGAGLSLPLRTLVVRRPDVNAITLPGGRIYVFNGLLTKADSIDEVAGVLGHEIGHVAHRDGTKSVLETAGLSLLFGMLLGDFTGGGAVIVAGKTVLRTAYSRAAEAAADEFGAKLMYKVGGDPHALGAFLLRISGKSGAVPHFLLDHPQAQERADAIARIAQPSPARALLTPTEWGALKRICAEG
ncbi:MAG TPA: M48 family metallopeptidase [Xanthobacteraceae bacterium]|jgi:Zn-dependent protease with chaperone function|nr:M48 family metallopeptidase [Xanthobacteraceae bacterium]